MHSFTNAFILSNTLHVLDSLSIHHQELNLYIQQQVYVEQRLLASRKVPTSNKVEVAV